MKWYEALVSILTGLSVAIPLVVQLVKYVEKAVKEKNWGDLLALVTNLMAEAEGKFESGSERKDWVLTCVKASADTINYDINLDEVSELIDNLCAMSKVVNAPKSEEIYTEEVAQIFPQ